MLIIDAGQVVPAAAAVDGAAGALADVDVASPFASVTDALPGSQVSQSCLWVSTRLGAAVQVYAERISGLAAAARCTAVDVERTDGAVSQGLHSPGLRRHGPR